MSNFKNGERDASFSAEFRVLLKVKVKLKMIFGHGVDEKEGNFSRKQQRQRDARQELRYS